MGGWRHGHRRRSRARCLLGAGAPARAALGGADVHRGEPGRPPPAAGLAFGATPGQADELLGLVLAGTKTATASAQSDYAAAGEDLPEPGVLGIVLDGSGHPRALVVTTQVRVVPFDEVDAAHAHDEGEGDRSLAHWRAVHERFFAAHSAGGFESSMSVVLERFEVLYPST